MDGTKAPSSAARHAVRAILRAVLTTALLSLASACGRCGAPEPAPGAGPLDDVLRGAKGARGEAPVDVLPGEVTLALASPDPMAWKRFADERPLWKALSSTPLVDDARVSGAFLALESIRHRVAGLSSFVGAPEDGDALFVGPVAIGVVERDDGVNDLVVAKRLDPTLVAVARFASAFASLASEAAVASGGAPRQVASRDVVGVALHIVKRRNDVVAFAFFKDLLVFGTSEPLVEAAVRIAAGEASEAPPLVKTDAGRVLGEKGASGVHIVKNVDPSTVVGAAGARAIGISLVLDASAPVVLRVCGDLGESARPDALLEHLPSSTFAALLVGRPLAEVVAPLAERELGDGAMAADVVDFARALEGGALLAYGVLPDDEAGATPAAALVALHRDRGRIEAKASALLAKLTGTPVARTVLEHQAGSVLLEAASGPTFGITDDTLVAALDAARVRAVLAARAAKAPRLVDRAQIAGQGPASLGLYLDVARGASFLERFYGAWARDDRGAPGDAMATLAPTFAALRTGGHGFARLAETKDGVVEGAFRVLP